MYQRPGAHPERPPAAEFLGISRSLAYQLFRQKDFPTIPVSRRKLVRREALLAWLDAHPQEREEVVREEVVREEVVRDENETA
ncbi:helix-turn-helix domain-containing protein [Butyricicoccus pullicaecorum]|uniref:helix-turn-helix domain-containing protein n=1 Tax=Butyricicoccus pullicaecorum TaxID=501571 RepID=UPI00352144B9